MKRFFITGTDTNVGKTVVSAILSHALKSHYWKPIQSGYTDDLTDTDFIRHYAGLPPQYVLSSCYSFAANLSPHEASALENKVIDLGKCVLPDVDNTLIVEGAGGVFVPLNHHESMLDLMQKLNLPIVLVCRGTLGTINHTLLTLHALRQHGLTVAGLIFNGELNINNKNTLEKWGNVPTLLSIPVFKELTPVHLQAWAVSQRAIIQEAFL